MSQDWQKVIARNPQFYRNNFRKLVTVLLVLIVIAYGLLGTLLYLQHVRPLSKFFATTSDGRLIEVEPLSNL